MPSRTNQKITKKTQRASLKATCSAGKHLLGHGAPSESRGAGGRHSGEWSPPDPTTPRGGKGREGKGKRKRREAPEAEGRPAEPLGPAQDPPSRPGSPAPVSSGGGAPPPRRPPVPPLRAPGPAAAPHAAPGGAARMRGIRAAARGTPGVVGGRAAAFLSASVGDRGCREACRDKTSASEALSGGTGGNKGREVPHPAPPGGWKP